MSKFDNTKYEDLVNTFGLVTKRVLKKELSRNKCKNIEYTTILTESYNDVTRYINEFYNHFTTENKTILKNTWIKLRDKLKQSFSKILHDYSIPTELCEQIDLKAILRKNFTEAELTEYGNTSLNFPTPNRDIETESANSETNSVAGSSIDINEIFQDFQNIPTTANDMAPMMGLEFMNLASKSINRNYNGDPLALDAHINSVELLAEFSHDAIKGSQSF